MTYTLTMDEQFTTPRTQEAAFLYVADFSTIEQWDHTVTHSEKVSDGVVGLGTRFRLTLKFGLRHVPMDYRITAFDFPHRVVLEGQGSGFKAIDTVSFIPQEDGETQVLWHADVIFDGVMAKLAPLLEQRIKAAGHKTVQGLAEALGDDFPAPSMLTKHKIADQLVFPGMWLFTKRGYYKAKPRWSPDSADIRGKNMVVTGATSGIGMSAAYDLAHRGAHLTLVARNPDKAMQVQQDMQCQTGNSNITVEIADMSLMKEVVALADRLIARDEPVDVLINNAGNLFNPRGLTTEGIEQSFALLLLAPYILTERLYPVLQASRGRVVNVSSGGMYSQRITPDDMENDQGDYSGSVAYAKAKRGLMICTEEWASRWQQDGIVINAMHPGWADTPSVANTLPEFYKITKPVLRTPQEGGDTISWLAAATQASKVSGQFFLDREPHLSHMTSSTVETPEQRQKLLNNLQEYAARFTS